ncbi:MAG: putative ABC transporter permease [Acutalibacteraceae bacterium]|nr:putative ABC transporter permease [Acutalibacteraceae bacterium]
MNLGGYICLQFSLAWGLCVVLAVRFLHRAVEALVQWLPFPLGMVLICILTAYFVTDAVVTVLTICRINRSLAVLSDMAAKLRRDSDALSGGLGRLALHADEQLARQRETLCERAQDTRAELEEKAQAQRGRLLEKQAAYHAALEEKRVQMQGAAERLRAEWLSRSTGVQRRMQRRLLKAFPRMRHERDGEALRRVRAWLEEKRR